MKYSSGNSFFYTSFWAQLCISWHLEHNELLKQYVFIISHEFVHWLDADSVPVQLAEARLSRRASLTCLGSHLGPWGSLRVLSHPPAG